MLRRRRCQACTSTFSRMEDVSGLDGQAFSVNWKYVAAMLCLTQIQIQSTGLNDSVARAWRRVRRASGRPREPQLLLEIRSSCAQTAEVIEDARRRAADALRGATYDCVHAWASSYSSLVHLLSGGLDSSIILASPEAGPLTAEDGMPQLLFLRVQRGRAALRAG